MRTLSKREKILIYAMVLVVIAGCGFMLIRQARKAYSEAQTAYDDREMELTIASMDKDTVEGLKTAVQSKKENYESAKSQFGLFMYGDEVENELMLLAKSCGLTTTATTVSEGALEESSSLPDTNENVADTEDNTVADGVSLDDGDENIDLEDTEEATTEETTEELTVAEENKQKGFTNATVTLSLTGTIHEFLNFLEKCRETDCMKVTSFSMYTETEENLDTSEDTAQTFYVEIAYYMQDTNTDVGIEE